MPMLTLNLPTNTSVLVRGIPPHEYDLGFVGSLVS
jgi:hypothetical protein